MKSVLPLIVLHIHLTLVQGTIYESPTNVTYVSGMTPLPIELTCNVTGTALWIVNGTDYRLGRLNNGDLPGHDLTGTNILVNSPMNNTEYICVSQNDDNSENISDPAYIIIIAGVPDMVSGVRVDDNTITINGDIITRLRLSWEVPFDNLDPIVNYALSCSGDHACPPNSTTTDSNGLIITNLTTMTTYTFLVVATNSIGSGEAGVVVITTPVIDQVTGVKLTCEVMDLYDYDCTLMWNPVTQGNVTGYQVYYNGTMMNVNNSTTTSTFTAPPLPDDVFNDTIVGIVTAISRYGIGPASDPATAMIYASSVIRVDFFYTDIITESYTVTVTCTTGYCETRARDNSSMIIIVGEGATITFNISGLCITHPNSIADHCELSARDNNNVTTAGNERITNGRAFVAVHGLKCGVEYTVVAGGTLNGSLIGPRRLVAIINTTDTCDEVSVITFVNRDPDCDDSCIVGSAVGGVAVIGISITLVVIVAVCMYIRCRKKSKVTDQEKGGNKQKTDKKSKDRDTIRQPLQDDKAISPEAKNMDDYATVDKSDDKPDQQEPNQPDDYATVDKSDDKPDQQEPNQPGGINYADLDIGKGPNVKLDGDHGVYYAQTTS